MKKFLTFTLTTLVAAGVVTLLGQQPAPAPGGTNAEKVAPAGGSQNADTKAAKGKGRGRGPARPTGPTPHLADGTVDLSGVWNGGGPVGDIAQGLPKGEMLPLNDAGKKVLAARLSKDDPEANCLPTGVPRQSPYPWRMVQAPGHIFILFEGNIHSYRQIIMGGKHPADPDPTWYGNSTGTWEGETLVVDTVGYNDKFWFDFKGNPHSEKMHTIERYERKDLGTLAIETTIEDPVYYSHPFKVNFTANLRPNEELMEYICQENQQDAQHLIGGAGLN
jgi:hypothetical protein